MLGNLQLLWAGVVSRHELYSRARIAENIQALRLAVLIKKVDDDLGASSCPNTWTRCFGGWCSRGWRAE
jgi:hypothetical protein